MAKKIRFNCPAISVIIPLYNAEKYIGECLDSILAQTFTNFEVIIVDDCSTDSSPAIVQSYAKHFGGRLRLMSMNKNSGSGTEPRNFGLAYSRGEYIYFMDNDDVVAPTAFEELYTHAKNFDADVVQCEKYYNIPNKFWNDAAFRAQCKPYNYLTKEKIFVTEPLVWQNNFEERIKFFCQKKLIWNYWVQLIRRDFLIANAIKMVGIIADDMIFTICELCSAPKYVVVPNVIYFYRKRKDSLLHKKIAADKELDMVAAMLKDGVRYLDEFLNQRDFFAQRPNLKYALFNAFAKQILKSVYKIYAQVPASALDTILRKEFCDGDNTALTSFVFNMMNIYYLKFMTAQRHIAELENALKIRR